MRNENAKVSNPNDFVTDPGSPERVIYSAKIKPDGSLEVVPSGKENIQDKIESFRDQTDISYIIHQIAIGNSDALFVQPGQYGDFTKVPKNMAEALQLQIDAETAWNGLPVDVRAKFDYDLTKWLVTAGSEDWNKKMFPPEEIDLNNNGSGALDAQEEGSK